MKAIKNMQTFFELLSKEDQDWQLRVYDQTGVIVHGGYLFSKCGYIDLDREAEYCMRDGVDCTDYCEITSIKDLCDYILGMDGYKDYLTDISYGKFTKSELFWAIYARLICPETNQRHTDGSIYKEWGLYSIGKYDGHVELNMALIDYNYADFELDINENTELNEALALLSKEMCRVTEDIEDVPQYMVIEEEPFSVPNDYAALSAQLSTGGLFDWLA